MNWISQLFSIFSGMVLDIVILTFPAVWNWFHISLSCVSRNTLYLCSHWQVAAPKQSEGYLRCLIIKRYPPLFLFRQKIFDWTFACIYYDHPVFLTLVGLPWWAAASLDVECLYEARGGGLNAEQLRLPQHGARGCLCRCYYGDMPLHSLCYVIKF